MQAVDNMVPLHNKESCCVIIYKRLFNNTENSLLVRNKLADILTLTTDEIITK